MSTSSGDNESEGQGMVARGVEATGEVATTSMETGRDVAETAMETGRDVVKTDRRGERRGS